MYMPPLLEALGLAEFTHDARNNRMRAGLISARPRARSGDSAQGIGRQRGSVP